MMEFTKMKRSNPIRFFNFNVNVKIYERVMVEVITLLFFLKRHLKLLEKNLNFKNQVLPTDEIFLENLGNLQNFLENLRNVQFFL